MALENNTKNMFEKLIILAKLILKSKKITMKRSFSRQNITN